MSLENVDQSGYVAPDREARGLALRLAFAATIGFTVAEVMGATLPFMAPLLAIQLLIGNNRPPTLAQGLGFVVVIAAATWIAMLMAGFLIDLPVVCVLILGLIFFLCFLLDARRRGGPMPGLLLVTTAMMPVLTLQSPDLAAGMAWILSGAGLLAVLIVWGVHALFPSSSAPTTTPQAPPISEMSPERFAIMNVLILMPLIVSFLVQGDELSIVILITVITILRLPLSAGQGAAIGLLFGNLAGGLAGLIAFQFITVFPSLVFLFLIVLLVGLIISGRIATAGAMAPIYIVGLTTFLIIFGTGVSPLPSGSGEAFLSRVLNIALAVIYVLGAMSLLRQLPKFSKAI